LLLAICVSLSFGAVFDPYSRRYGVCKDSMDSLLTVPSGSTSCTLISGLSALSTKANFTASQTTIFNAFVKNIETTIVKNTTYYTTNQARFTAIAEQFDNLGMNQAAIYNGIKYLNISTWGPVDFVVQITKESHFKLSLELVVAQSLKGDCKLFDLLLSACSGDSEKHSALSAFIESDLKAIVKDKSKSQTEVLIAIKASLETKFFIGTRASWNVFFFKLRLPGFCQFSRVWDVAFTYQRKTSLSVVLGGQGMECPFIVSLNATLSSSSYTTVQKGFIKQLMNYFIQQWTVTVTIEARMNLISMKFSEACDTSYAYFAVLNGISIQGFNGGCWWDLIIISCQIDRIPTSCGCPIPTLEVSTEAPTTTVELTTTEAATTTAEMSTTEAATTEGASTTIEGSTWDTSFSGITFPSTMEGCSCSCEM
jgi:hypothetical protein